MGNKLIVGPWILVVLTYVVFGVGTAEMEGLSVTLHTDGQEYEQIKWIFKPQNRNGEEEWYIAGCRVNKTPLCEIRLQTDEQINTFRDRLKIHNNGSLTIKNISIEQAGLYTLQTINKSKKSYERKINVGAPAPAPKTVNKSDQTIQPSQPYSDSGLSPGYVALICVLVLGGAGVAVAAAAVFFYKRRKARRDVRRNECGHRYEKKNGTDSSINSHPEERRSFRINEEP